MLRSLPRKVGCLPVFLGYLNPSAGVYNALSTYVTSSFKTSLAVCRAVPLRSLRFSTYSFVNDSRLWTAVAAAPPADPDVVSGAGGCAAGGAPHWSMLSGSDSAPAVYVVPPRRGCCYELAERVPRQRNEQQQLYVRLATIRLCEVVDLTGQEVKDVIV